MPPVGARHCLALFRHATLLHQGDAVRRPYKKGNAPVGARHWLALFAPTRNGTQCLLYGRLETLTDNASKDVTCDTVRLTASGGAPQAVGMSEPRGLYG